MSPHMLPLEDTIVTNHWDTGSILMGSVAFSYYCNRTTDKRCHLWVTTWQPYAYVLLFLQLLCHWESLKFNQKFGPVTLKPISSAFLVSVFIVLPTLWKDIQRMPYSAHLKYWIRHVHSPSTTIHHHIINYQKAKMVGKVILKHRVI